MEARLWPVRVPTNGVQTHGRTNTWTDKHTDNNKWTNTNEQIQTDKYKRTNTNGQVQTGIQKRTEKQKRTNTGTDKPTNRYTSKLANGQTHGRTNEQLSQECQECALIHLFRAS